MFRANLVSILEMKNARECLKLFKLRSFCLLVRTDLKVGEKFYLEAMVPEAGNWSAATGMLRQNQVLHQASCSYFMNWTQLCSLLIYIAFCQRCCIVADWNTNISISRHYYMTGPITASGIKPSPSYRSIMYQHQSKFPGSRQ